MKSKLTISLLLVISIVFLSCKKEEVETEETTATAIQQPIIVPKVQPIPTETYVQPNQQVNMPSQAPQTLNQTPFATKVGMNPPHGQPEHRCDIAVGAPLNSPVAKPSKSAVSNGQTTFTQTPLPTSTSTVQSGTPALLKTDTPTAPGMNPPHGQDGHRCDIAVGQPLPK